MKSERIGRNKGSGMKKKLPLTFGKIDLIVYDFDGVMTDNKVILREDGLESVVVNRSDGLAVEILKNMGIRQIILSKEKNPVVGVRANKLGIPVVQGINDKRKVLSDYCEKNTIRFEDVVYIGNDLNDIEVMKAVGYPLCPLDAYDEVKEISKLVLGVRGGDGVVRNLLKYLMHSSEVF